MILRSVSRALIVLSLLAANLALAQAPTPAPILPAMSARSWLLIDITANHLVAAVNQDERVEPASLTKLMTAYVVFAAIKERKITRDKDVAVSERAWKTGGSKMFIEPKKSVTVEELLHGMIVQSGNDASVALAEAVGGSEEAFVVRMNDAAKRMGLKNTSFANSSGLPDPKHYSTAYDVALLASAIIREFPEFYSLYSLKEYRYNNITQANRNRLLWLDTNVDGVKTGHTEKAGYCLVASAKRGERRLLSVVMGTVSDSARTQESQTLLNFGFQFYDTVRVHEKGATISKMRLWKGTESDVAVGVDSTVFVAIPKGTNEKIKAELVSQQPLIAPLTKGQRVGVIKVNYEGRLMSEHPVVALADVGQTNVLGRAWDTMRLWFK
jgi:serine-type D-Ala-D-Ala carboxypeptidase (penicillin-binding protein 5/6)